jgi:hypothetical protein
MRARAVGVPKAFTTKTPKLTKDVFQRCENGFDLPPSRFVAFVIFVVKEANV